MFKSMTRLSILGLVILIVLLLTCGKKVKSQEGVSPNTLNITIVNTSCDQGETEPCG